MPQKVLVNIYVSPGNSWDNVKSSAKFAPTAHTSVKDTGFFIINDDIILS
jgi:hypothetical protein